MDCVCLRCGQAKPRAAFAGRWGTSVYCKQCYPEWVREHKRRMHATPESVARERERQRDRYRSDPAFAESRKRKAHAYRLAHPEHVAAKKREWARLHPDKVRDAVERSRRRHPERAFAREMVNKAVAQGRVVPQPCWCGATDAEAHHHRGYALEHVFDVVWLCTKHHRELHRKYPR